jgi:hypothetical protein
MMALASGQRTRRYLAPDKLAAIQRTARRHRPGSFEREL